MHLVQTQIHRKLHISLSGKLPKGCMVYYIGWASNMAFSIYSATSVLRTQAFVLHVVQWRTGWWTASCQRCCMQCYNRNRSVVHRLNIKRHHRNTSSTPLSFTQGRISGLGFLACITASRVANDGLNCCHYLPPVYFPPGVRPFRLNRRARASGGDEPFVFETRLIWSFERRSCFVIMSKWIGRRTLTWPVWTATARRLTTGSNFVPSVSVRCLVWCDARCPCVCERRCR